MEAIFPSEAIEEVEKSLELVLDMKALQESINKKTENKEIKDNLARNMALLKKNVVTDAKVYKALEKSIMEESNLVRPMKNWNDTAATYFIKIIDSWSKTSQRLPTKFMGDYLNYLVKSKSTHHEQLNQMLHPSVEFGSIIPQELFDFWMYLLSKKPVLLANSERHKGYTYNSEEKQVEITACPICNSEESTAYWTAFSYLTGNFSNPFLPMKLWMKCSHCGDMYSKYMPDTYCCTQDGQVLLEPCKELGVPHQVNSGKLNIWSNILNKANLNPDKKRLLEVGIGQGELLAVALEMGYDVEAVELLEEEAQKVANCLDIPIWCSDFLKFETENKYDIIIMGDVIEHVMNPLAALEKAYSLLDDTGILWLSTPNYKSAYSRLQREMYVMWLEPYHLTFFSYDGLKVLFEKVGFEVMEYTASTRYVGCMELFLKKKK